MGSDITSIEIITLEVFAERMHVGETTVWKWIRTGKLVPGVHFIKLDRIIRFEWGPELIKKLHEISAPPVLPDKYQEELELKPIKNTRRYGRKINFNI